MANKTNYYKQAQIEELRNKVITVIFSEGKNGKTQL